MKKFIIVLNLVVPLLILSSCSENHIEETTDKSQTMSLKSIGGLKGVSLMKIDNGLDGQILMFDSSEDFIRIQDDLYNSSELYDDEISKLIPEGLTEEEEEEFLERIGYNEDKVYEEFEDALGGFNSLRKKINVDAEIWLDKQTGDYLDEEGDPDNNPLVLEAERALYNQGNEVIVKDSLGNPIIYKLFDWGHVEIKDLNFKTLTDINTFGLYTPEKLKGNLILDSTVYDFFPIKNTPLPCITERRVLKKHYYSSAGQNTKAIVKLAVPPFNKKAGRLVAKTKGYVKKKGKWKNRRTNITIGITGKASQKNIDGKVYIGGCEVSPFVIKKNARTKKKKKIDTQTGTFGSYLYVKKGKIYAYHEQGNFKFTVDFYGTSAQDNSFYEISY